MKKRKYNLKVKREYSKRVCIEKDNKNEVILWGKIKV